MLTWTKKQVDWYYKAIEYSEYPDIFVQYIRPYLNKNWTLLDLGSGAGAFTLQLAPYVNKILALDRDYRALKALQEKVRSGEKDRKIDYLTGEWPEVSIPEVNVCVSSYSGDKVLASEESLKKMIRKTGDYIFLICPAENNKVSWCQLYSQKKKHVSTYKDTEIILKKMGVCFKTKTFTVDFSQPVENMEDAAEFISWQLGVTNELAKSIAEDYVEVFDERLVLPIQKKASMIIIKTQRR